MTGCARFTSDNTAVEIPPPGAAEPTLAEMWLKSGYLYPGRDWLTLSWAGRALLGDEAWNVAADGSVADSSVFENRDVSTMPAGFFSGDGVFGPAPRGPWRVVRLKRGGGTPGFVGEDAGGRRWVVKPDAEGFDELGSAAEAIAARVYFGLGYRVPATHVVTIHGTGDAQWDGRRASASALLPGEPAGTWRMDRLRMRREVRALRLAAAWLNDTDRHDRNTLVTIEDGRARFWLIDFNGALGCWNGRPKAPWRGWRYAWDVEWQVLGALTLGLARPGYAADQPVISTAVGRLDSAFEPMTWRGQYPVTAFDRMTPADARWMVTRMLRLSEAQLDEVVAAGAYSRAEDSMYIRRVLGERRARIAAAVGGG